jgi:hypothetical protein
MPRQPLTAPPSPTLYTDWVRTNDPGRTADARSIADDLAAAAPRALAKPGRLLDDLARRARSLPPAHRPPFWDTAGYHLLRYSRRHAALAYGHARAAETENGLAADSGHRIGVALLFARSGALAAKEIRAHQRWLAATYTPEAAHAEFVRFLGAWAEGGAAPSADLHTRVRASAQAAGLGVDEDARLLGGALTAAAGTAVPTALLDGAARVFAQAPPDEEVRAALADLFPTGDTAAGAWLRLLAAAGTLDALVAGTVTPKEGPAGWLGGFPYHYAFAKVALGGISARPMPEELYAFLPRIAGRLRAAGEPVRLYESHYRTALFDADLVDACLAHGIPVADPGPQVRLHLWGDASRRDLRALAADPVFGRRLEGTVHATVERGTAITRLPRNPGIEASVHERITRLLDAAAEGGVSQASRAAAALDDLLDRSTVAALDGIGEALAGLDFAAPLARTLRAGIPDELVWPAMESALADLAAAEGRPVEEAVVGVTCTWPVLTLYGRTRAVAVDHTGRRGEAAFTLPADARRHTVHYAGGDLLVAWTARDAPYAPSDHAFWATDPAIVFRPEHTGGLAAYRDALNGALGYQFATADGRHDGERVLRPGDRSGIGDFERQMSDGHAVWSAEATPREPQGGWARLDPATGARTAPSLPAFFAAGPPEGLEWDFRLLSLAPLPDGVVSPLGSAGRLSGFRVAHPVGTGRGAARRWVVEGADGRRADLARAPGMGGVWGIVRLPEGGADIAVTHGSDHRAGVVQGYATDDVRLLWEARYFPSPRDHFRYGPERGSLMPPPAFWHFLVPRHPASSRALRAVDRAQAAGLVASASAAADSGGGRAEVRAAVARLLPAVTDPRVADGVALAAERAADGLRHRERLSHRVDLVRSGALADPPADVPERTLADALCGLVDDPRPRGSDMSPHPATLTALAAAGAFLRGEIDDDTRLLSAPAPFLDWTALLGAIDAAAWRAVAGPTGDDERAALSGLLRTWAAHPVAAPGSWRLGTAPAAALAPLCAAGRAVAAVGRDDAARIRRLLGLLAERGPLPLDEEAVAAFARRAGVRRAVAALAVAGLPRRAEVGSDTTARYEAHQRMLRSAPYRASKDVARDAERLSSRLGAAGRREVCAAAVPDDPAELWAPGGTVAAAERMADAWVRLLGSGSTVDEATAEALEAAFGLADEAGLLADPAASGAPEADLRAVLTSSRWGTLNLHYAGEDGEPGHAVYASPYRRHGALVAWALTERPVGDPALAGVPALYDRLRARLDAPDLLIPLGLCVLTGGDGDRARAFGPGTFPVRPNDDPAGGAVEKPVAYDDGLLVVGAHAAVQRPFLRPSGLAAPGALDRVKRVCAENGFERLAAEVRRAAVYYDGGLARMVRRAADTPVPVGGYEADPSLSVPALVAEAADALGVDADAAALYLQLLTLARPTDRAVRTWNGWTAKRHKAAQERLVAVGAVVQERRPRAGRTAFIPGGWTELRAPELPLETAKLAAHLAEENDKKELVGPFDRLLAPAPLHEMFATAWATR